MQSNSLDIGLFRKTWFNIYPTANGHEPLGPNADALLTQICTPKSIPETKPVIVCILESDYTGSIYERLLVAYKHNRLYEIHHTDVPICSTHSGVQNLPSQA